MGIFFSHFYVSLAVIPMTRILVILIGCAVAGQAQVNTERMRRIGTTEGWSNELGLAMSVFGGNSRLLLLNGSYRLDWVGKQVYCFVVGNYVRGMSGGDVVLNKGFAHARLQRSLSNRWKAEVFAQKEFNDFIQLSDRQLGGGGLRFECFGRDTNIVHERPVDVTLGSGLMYETEKFSESTKQETRFVRSTNYLSIRLKRNKQTFLSAVGYFQTAVDRLAQFRILFETTAGFSISQSVIVTASMNYRYDRQPAQGVKRHDYSLSNGVTISF